MRFPWTETAVVFLLSVAFVGLATVKIAVRPDAYYNEDFLIGEQGFNLLLAQEILDGKRLYRDVFSQYGVLPPYLHAGLAHLCGNSIGGYLAYTALGTFLHFALLYRLLRSCLPLHTTLFVLLFGLVPCALFPLALRGAYTNNAYLPLERCCIALLALAWQPPRDRTVSDGLRLGAILGLWQGVKFGGAFFGLAALLVLDGACVLVSRTQRLGWKKWGSAWLATVAAFAASELLWVAAAFALLPEAIAWDTLWPAFMVEHYAAHDFSPYPVWNDWTDFFMQQLGAIVSGLLAVGGLVTFFVVRFEFGSIGPKTRDWQRGRLLLPLIFYAVAYLGYFRHVHHAIAAEWCMVLASALSIDGLPRRLWLGVLVFWLPALVQMSGAYFSSPHEERPAVFPLPDGEVIYTPEPTRQMLVALTAALDEVPAIDGAAAPHKAVLFFPLGAGLHQKFRIPIVQRHAWYLEHFLRPYDEEPFAEAAAQARAFVYLDSWEGSTADLAWARPVFSERLCQRLSPRLGEPLRLSRSCFVFPVKQP